MPLPSMILSQQALLILFVELDPELSGSVPARNAATALANAGDVAVSRAEVFRLMQELGYSRHSRLTFVEFVRLYRRVSLYTIFKSVCDDDYTEAIPASAVSQAFFRFEVFVTAKGAAQALAKTRPGVAPDAPVTFADFERAFSSWELSKLHVHGNEWSALVRFDASVLGVVAPTPPSFAVTHFIIAGGLGGACARLSVGPLERAQLLAQSGRIPRGQAAVTTMRRIVQEEGARALWKGTTPALLRVFPFAGVVCLSYTSMLDLAPPPCGDGSGCTVWRLVSGATAGAAAATLTYPLDLLRTHMAVQGSASQLPTGTAAVAAQRASAPVPRGPSLTLVEVATAIVRANGPWALFRGLRPTLLAVVPFVAVQQTSYDIVLAWAKRGHPAHPADFVLAGVAAGLCAQTATYPIDLMRRRIQLGDLAALMQPPASPAATAAATTAARAPAAAAAMPSRVVGGSVASPVAAAAAAPANTPTSLPSLRTPAGALASMLRSVKASAGLRGLFQGLGATYAKVIPSVTITLVVRDMVLGRIGSGDGDWSQEGGGGAAETMLGSSV